MMPTAAKLASALCLAGLAWIVTDMIKPSFPEGTDFGILNYVNAGIALICGWIVLGGRAGRGYSAAISHGITATAAAVFWCVFVHAADEMTSLAMRNRYGDPLEAIAGVFEIGIAYLGMMATGQIILTLVIGSVLSGALAEWVWRRWR